MNQAQTGPWVIQVQRIAQIPHSFFIWDIGGILLKHIYPPNPFTVWSLSCQFQISLRLTSPAFPRPVSLRCHRCPEWQSGQPYLVLPASLIHNIITFTWPCHASYRRWMSLTQGQQGNDPHPGRDGAQSPVTLNLYAAGQIDNAEWRSRKLNNTMGSAPTWQHRVWSWNHRAHTPNYSQ